MTNPPSTVDEVIDRLREIDQALDPDDGVAVFNQVYLTVTERLAEALEDGETFRDPDFMADLDVRFARLWFEAYAASSPRTAPKPWAPLFEHRRSPHRLSVQFALSGVNAHVEHDLPLAVIETCAARRTSPRRAAVEADYEAVNGIIASVESEVRRSFLSDLGRHIDDRIGAVVHLVNSWNIDKARDLAWVSVEALWALRRSGELAGRYRSVMAHSVGMTSRYLLTPVDVVVVA